MYKIRMSNNLLLFNPLGRVSSHVRKSSVRCTTSSAIQSEISAAHERWRDQIALVRSDDSSFGVRALRPFTKGSTVLSGNFMGQPLAHRTSHTIQVGIAHHVLMDLPARFLNHSCDANLGARKRPGTYDFIARRDIDLGEDLVFDYETTEYELGVPFKCRCGSTLCRADIKGFRYHAKTICGQVDSEWIADYLLEIQSK